MNGCEYLLTGLYTVVLAQVMEIFSSSSSKSTTKFFSSSTWILFTSSSSMSGLSVWLAISCCQWGRGLYINTLFLLAHINYNYNKYVLHKIRVCNPPCPYLLEGKGWSKISKRKFLKSLEMTRNRNIMFVWHVLWFDRENNMSTDMAFSFLIHSLPKTSH